MTTNIDSAPVRMVRALVADGWDDVTGLFGEPALIRRFPVDSIGGVAVTIRPIPDTADFDLFAVDDASQVVAKGQFSPYPTPVHLVDATIAAVPGIADLAVEAITATTTGTDPDAIAAAQKVNMLVGHVIDTTDGRQTLWLAPHSASTHQACADYMDRAAERRRIWGLRYGALVVAAAPHRLEVLSRLAAAAWEVTESVDAADRWSTPGLGRLFVDIDYVDDEALLAEFASDPEDEDAGLRPEVLAAARARGMNAAIFPMLGDDIQWLRIEDVVDDIDDNAA